MGDLGRVAPAVSPGEVFEGPLYRWPENISGPPVNILSSGGAVNRLKILAISVLLHSMLNCRRATLPGTLRPFPRRSILQRLLWLAGLLRRLRRHRRLGRNRYMRIAGRSL